MKNKLIFLPSAVDDLDEIILYIAESDKNEALKVKNEIIDKIEKLKEFPKLGRIVSEVKIRKKGYRMLVYESYLIFYRIIEEKIYIYRILHGKRDYSSFFKDKF